MDIEGWIFANSSGTASVKPEKQPIEIAAAIALRPSSMIKGLLALSDALPVPGRSRKANGFQGCCDVLSGCLGGEMVSAAPFVLPGLENKARTRLILGGL